MQAADSVEGLKPWLMAVACGAPPVHQMRRNILQRFLAAPRDRYRQPIQDQPSRGLHSLDGQIARSDLI